MARFLKIRTRNTSANILKNKIPTDGKNVVLRLGSTTPTNIIFPNVDPIFIQEINIAKACEISGNKSLMKYFFLMKGVITADWRFLEDLQNQISWTKFPAIIKHNNSSKGKGIYYIKTLNDLEKFIESHSHNCKNYIIEEYLPYVKEYRLHVTEEGCFYTCRKMLKNEAEERWHRHDNNSVWILEENPLFDKPSNWEDIVLESVKALKSVGLQIGAVDIKVQSSKFKNPKFVILEINSAPALGKLTTIKYLEVLPKLIK